MVGLEFPALGTQITVRVIIDFIQKVCQKRGSGYMAMPMMGIFVRSAGRIELSCPTGRPEGYLAGL